MDTIGLDVHKRESQLCIISGDGSISERRILSQQFAPRKAHGDLLLS